MKKIIVLQSILEQLELIQFGIKRNFPHLDDVVVYQSNFEETLAEITNEDELVVIASDWYHDDKHIHFSRGEKNGDRLAEEVKKINPLARVYIFSEYEPQSGHIDGFYIKSPMGRNAHREIISIFRDLYLDK